MAKKGQSVESTKKRKKALLVEVVFDPLKEEEFPEYRRHLQELVTLTQQDSTPGGLGPKQIALAFVVTNPRVFPRTVTMFCQLADCDRSFYYMCRQNPKWVEFKNKLAKRLTDDSYDEAMMALHELVRLRDAKGLRLFFELRGDLVHKVESTNVTETHEERMKRLKEKARQQGGGSQG